MRHCTCYICGKDLSVTIDHFYEIMENDPTGISRSEPKYICRKCYRVADFLAVTKILKDKYPYASTQMIPPIPEKIRELGRQ